MVLGGVLLTRTAPWMSILTSPRATRTFDVGFSFGKELWRKRFITKSGAIYTPNIGTIKGN